MYREIKPGIAELAASRCHGERSLRIYGGPEEDQTVSRRQGNTTFMHGSA